jgi:hypothetical protein
MRRFQLSLRDVFIAVTVLCAQLALFVAYFQFPKDYQTLFVGGLYGTAIFAIPIMLAIVVADVKRSLPLLSGVLAFVAVIQLSWATNVYDPIFLTSNYIAAGVFDADSPGESDFALYGLLAFSYSTLLALFCAWITRSLLPQSTDSPR